MLERFYIYDKRIEEWIKKFKKKHDVLLFLIFRLILYIYIADMTIRIQIPTGASEETIIILYIEAINYLIILGIILLFPTLSDFRL